MIYWRDLRYAERWLRECPAALVAEALGYTELELLRALGPPRLPRPWTAAEDERLRREYPSGDTAELARQMGRSVRSVRNRTSKLGLAKTTAWRLRPKPLKSIRGAVEMRYRSNDQSQRKE